MQTHHCESCGQRVFFQNSRCEACGAGLLFDPLRWQMVAADPDPKGPPGAWRRRADAAPLRACDWVAHGVCNWACSTEGDTLCLSCQCTRTFPGQADDQARIQWAKAELAKRRLMVNLRQRGVPVWRQDGIEPMRFDLLSPRLSPQPILTGHAQGLITLNLDEVDPVHRVEQQQRFAEPYRTVLGHLRHESGHFYWDTLVSPDGGLLSQVRDVFGDERQDYATALAAHHERVAAAGDSSLAPPDGFISLYASAHPWEDWAETWSHYLMMLDAMEVQQPALWADVMAHRESFETLLARWQTLTLHLNDLNRALGWPDPYPFVLSAPVRAKLLCVHTVVSDTVVSR